MIITHAHMLTHRDFPDLWIDKEISSVLLSIFLLIFGIHDILAFQHRGKFHIVFFVVFL